MIKYILINLKSFLFLFLVTVLFASCSSSKKGNVNTEDPEKAYSIAMSSYNKGDFLQAIEDFSIVKLRFSGTSVADKAQYYLAMSYFKRGEYILAAYEFELYMKNYPSGSFVVQSRYNLAMCYYRLSPEYYLDQTYTRLAISEFRNFLELYPNEPLANEADTRIKELRTKLARKILASADLYMDMDDYRAATVYYDYVLNDYFDTDFADDAMYGKIQSLIKRQKFDQAFEEAEKFEQRFKSSPFLNAVKSLKSQARNNIK